MGVNNKKAFTLIEVLIALLIIAIALAAAIRATNDSVQTTIHIRNTMTAHWVALNILSEIETKIGPSQPTPENPVSGSTEMLGQKWNWTARAQTSSQLDNITRITVTVSLRGKVISSVSGFV